MSSPFHYRIAFLFVLLCSLPAKNAARQDLCLLCEDGNAGLKYPNAVIKSDGTTCAGMAVNTAVYFVEDSEECIEHLQAWRPICCGDDQPLDVEITDVFDTYPDIDDIETTGQFSKCDLCRDGDYPSSESMVINMLYVGEGSCPQYWKAGQQGMIPNHLCAPLQYFGYEPCGCGEFSTNGNYNWGDSYSGDEPSDASDDAPWWSDANSNTNSNSNHGSTDDEAPWWGGADSNSRATPTSARRILAAMLMASTSFALLL